MNGIVGTVNGVLKIRRHASSQGFRKVQLDVMRTVRARTMHHSEETTLAGVPTRAFLRQPPLQSCEGDGGIEWRETFG